MKFWRICIVAVVLLAAGLACGFPFGDDEKPPEIPGIDEEPDIPPIVPPTTISSVSVHPSTGNGSFTLSVRYSDNGFPENILCRYQNNKGSQSRPLPTITFKKSETGVHQTNWPTYDLTFNLTEPGQYTVTCESESGKSSANTGFTVTQEQAPKPPEPPIESSYPKKFIGSGTGKVIHGEPNDYDIGYCEAQQNVTLTIEADGSAVLNVRGPMYSNTTECTQVGGSTMSWDIIGTLISKDAESVTFTSCNEGGFDADGEVTFSGGAITGFASCMWNSGSDAGKKRFEINMP